MQYIESTQEPQQQQSMQSSKEMGKEHEQAFFKSKFEWPTHTQKDVKYNQP